MIGKNRKENIHTIEPDDIIVTRTDDESKTEADDALAQGQIFSSEREYDLFNTLSESGAKFNPKSSVSMLEQLKALRKKLLIQYLVTLFFGYTGILLLVRKRYEFFAFRFLAFIVPILIAAFVHPFFFFAFLPAVAIWAAEVVWCWLKYHAINRTYQSLKSN